MFEDYFIVWKPTNQNSVSNVFRETNKIKWIKNKLGIRLFYSPMSLPSLAGYTKQFVTATSTFSNLEP